MLGVPGTAWVKKAGLEDATSTARSIGQSQVQFYRDFVRNDGGDSAPVALIRAGLVRPGESRAVVPATRVPHVGRVFYDARLPRPTVMGVDLVAMPSNPAEAVHTMQSIYKIQPGDLVLLPDDVSVEAAQQWRVAETTMPILLVPVAQLRDLSQNDLAALAAIARVLDGQVLRVQAETIVRARLGEEFFVSTQL